MEDPTNPTPCELELARYLLEQAPAGDWVPLTREQLAGGLSRAPSYVNRAVRRLEERGMLERESPVGGRAARYRLAPDSATRLGPASVPASVPDPTRLGPASDDYADAHAGARGLSPLTSIQGLSGTQDLSTTRPDPTRLEAGTRPASVPDPPPEDATPIGQLAVRAAMEAARDAGATVPAALRPRIGHAAQMLAKDEDAETIIAGARRLGAGGFEDLYTAVRAVKQDRPMPVPLRIGARPVQQDGKMGRVLQRVYGTWPRAQLSPELWEEKLGSIQERFLVAAIDRIAEEGGDFAPTWGKVWKVAHEVGQPVVFFERAEAARLREKARMQGSS